MTTYVANPGSTLSTGQFVSQGQQLVSSNGQYFAGLMGDGNFYVFKVEGHIPLYDSAGTPCRQYTPQGDQFFLIMQSDGNLVGCQGTSPETETSAVFAINQSWTRQPQGTEFYATMQDDGNFVVYQGAAGDNSTPIWATNTTQNS